MNNTPHPIIRFIHNKNMWQVTIIVATISNYGIKKK